MEHEDYHYIAESHVPTTARMITGGEVFTGVVILTTGILALLELFTVRGIPAVTFAGMATAVLVMGFILLGVQIWYSYKRPSHEVMKDWHRINNEHSLGYAQKIVLWFALLTALWWFLFANWRSQIDTFDDERWGSWPQVTAFCGKVSNISLTGGTEVCTFRVPPFDQRLLKMFCAYLILTLVAAVHTLILMMYAWRRHRKPITKSK